MSEKIYCFKFRNRRGVIYLKTDQQYNPEKLFRGEMLIDELIAYIVKGTTYNPYAHLPDPHNLGISKKWLNVLQENGITGWTSYRINIKDCEFEYFGLQIIGRTGSILRPAKPGMTKGINIDMTLWDKSDIFCAIDFYRILFTEKVKNALLASMLFSEQEFEDISQEEWYSAY